MKVQFARSCSSSVRQMFPFAQRAVIEKALSTGITCAIWEDSPEATTWMGLSEAWLDDGGETVYGIYINNGDNFLDVYGTKDELLEFLASFERQEWAKIPRRSVRRLGGKYCKIARSTSPARNKLDARISGREDGEFLTWHLRRKEGRSRARYRPGV